MGFSINDQIAKEQQRLVDGFDPFRKKNVFQNRSHVRHRDPNFNMINNFHWWETSRLLVRPAGAYGWCRYVCKWKRVTSRTMKIGNAGGILHKTLLKRPLKAVEVIGRGGTHE